MNPFETVTRYWLLPLGLAFCVHSAAAVLPAATPESQGLDSAKLVKMLDYLQTTGFNTDSVMLAKHGKLVLQAYVAPYRAGIPHQINSATKSFVSTLAGMAIADGKLSLDDTVAKVLPEYADLPTAQQITLRQLLLMNSGVNWEDWTEGGDFAQMLASPDPVKQFLQHTIDPAQVGRFNYNSGSSHLLGVMVAKVEGQPLGEFAQQRLFNPLGFGKTEWQKDRAGMVIGGRGLYVQPEDLLRFGELFRQHGQWQGKQVIPASWVSYATSPLLPVRPDSVSEQYYGAQWWVKKDGSSYMAAGWGGQYVIVYPQEDITLVLTSRRNDYSGHQSGELDADPLRTYFLLGDKATLPDNPPAQQALAQRVTQMAANPATTVSHSPLEKKISGKAIEVTDPHNWTSQWRLDFKGDEVAVTWSPRSFDAPTEHYAAGLDGVWRNAVQARSGRTWAARAKWLNDTTLQLSITPLEEFYIHNIVMTFTGKQVKIDVPGSSYATQATLRE